MKIIVAPDSFKGSLTAVQAAEALAAGINSVDPTIETVLLPAKPQRIQKQKGED